MNLVLYSNKIDEYLKNDDVINYENEAIAELADTLFQRADNETDYIKAAYEFVRDQISHSADIDEDGITCTASEVLKAGHGICFAKSHLLAALLRCKSIPAGFCYQKLILDDETAPVLIYHGLNGVYLKDCKKWIRLDARGNKAGVNAEFSVETEQLAFTVRPEMGEEDSFIVYPDPDKKVLEKLRENKTRTELWDDLPTELEYGMLLTSTQVNEMYRHIVQYYETDKMGITHHSNYIRWMEEARIDFLSKIGWSYAKLEEEGIISPVVAVECKYMQSTTFGDTVDIEVAVKEFKGVKLKLKYSMKNDKGNTVCEACSEHCFLDEKGIPIRLDKKYPFFYNALIECCSF